MDNRASGLFALLRGCKDSSGWRACGFGQRISLLFAAITCLLLPPDERAALKDIVVRWKE